MSSPLIKPLAAGASAFGANRIAAALGACAGVKEVRPKRTPFGTDFVADLKMDSALGAFGATTGGALAARRAASWRATNPLIEIVPEGNGFGNS